MIDADVLSPLGVLLRDVHHGEREADEVLVLTFNQDLAFLEKAALGLMEQLGARVSVIGDAAMVDHDPYAVHRAGVAYLPGLAHCRGAFHPKLVVIAGPDDATVAIGSGNLTLSGWHGNDECWSIHHADTETGSAVVAATASFLDRLAQLVVLSEGSGAALQRVADLLRVRPATDATTTLVSSLDQRILDQLPPGPVDELCLYAPFHDPGATAVKALIDRFDPGFIRLAVQPGLTHINGSATAALLEGRGELVLLADSPYRHGKLIEWRTGENRQALTGSPNISAAALLNNVDQGGNVELGVIAPIETSLFPDGPVADFDALRTIPFPQATPREHRPSAVLLSATLSAEGLVLQFAAPLTEAIAVQLSPLGALPDQWTDILEAPAASSEILINEFPPAGSRVRIRFGDGTVGGFVPVADPRRLLHTRRSSGGQRRPPAFDEVLRCDPQIVEQFWKILDELRAAERIPLPRPTAKPPSVGGGGGTFEVGDWEDYLERCQAKVGAAAIAFAFGLPYLNQPSGGVVVIDWDDEREPLDDDVGALEGDTPEDVDEDPPEELSTMTAVRKATETVRKRLRDGMGKVVASVADRDPHERLLAARMVLTLEAGGLWPAGDDHWAELLLQAIDAFPEDDAAEEYEIAAGSLAAVALSVVYPVLPTHHTNSLKTHHQHSTQRLAHLLVAADAERIEGYLHGMEDRFGAAADVDEILAMCDLIVGGDPVAIALDRLLDQGIVASADGRLIEMAEPVPNPLVRAYAALAAAEQASPVAIRSLGSGSGMYGWALLLWVQPDLFVIQPGKPTKSVMSRHYHYGPGTSPGIDISNDGQPDPNRNVGQTFAGSPLPEAAAALLTSLEVEV